MKFAECHPDRKHFAKGSCKPCYMKLRWERVKDKRNFDRREHFRNNPQLLRNRNLKRDFGIDLEQYNILFDSQKGLCAICREPETSTSRRGKTRQLSLDHCHKTGKIRGLLCNKCNRGLGYFKDNIQHVKRALTYLLLHASLKKEK